ncbi:MAG: caspase family protein [Spirochaetaceae bacterium]|nr:caspase family protein [Spirochaetaceae bacterium]
MKNSRLFVLLSLYVIITVILSAACVPVRSPGSADGGARSADGADSGLQLSRPAGGGEPQKYALVIGNGAYSGITRLNNPANDARDMEAALKSLGWTVELVINGSLDQMEGAAIRLRDRLSASSNSYGFLFYAGHGVQSGGENYLIPVDASIQSESFLRQRSVPVQALLDELNAAGNSLNVVVLDACRDNPFSWSRGGRRGLSVVGVQPADSIIVYATSAGSVAADGEGRNGLFTGHLLANLKVPGLEVMEIFRRTMGDVARASGNAQRPAVYSQFPGTAYLGSPPASAPSVAATPATPSAVAEPVVAPVQPATQPVPVAQAQRPASALAQTATAPQTAQRSELLRTLGHSSFVNSAAYSPDGRRIVSALLNWTVEIWDAESGQLIRTLSGHGYPIGSAAYSPDGRCIVSASHDGTVKIWNAETGQLIRTIEDSNWVASAAYSPDGRRIVSASWDDTVKVWDAESGQLIRTLSGHSDYVNSAAYSPDGRRIASASNDKTVKIWDAESGQLIRTIEDSNWVASAAYSPDGRRIASASYDKTVKIWDAESGQLIRTLSGHSDWVNFAAYSPDGRRIVSASDDKTVNIWDAGQ